MSASNADWNVNKEVADHAIDLSEEGKQQARAAGQFLAQWFAEHLLEQSQVMFSHSSMGQMVYKSPASIPRIRLWHSPYRRTRQTAQLLAESCGITGHYKEPVVVRGGRPEDPVMERNLLQFDDEDNYYYTKNSWFFDDDDEAPVRWGREHLLLAEQQFGLFDGLSDEEREAEYPNEQAYYEKCKAYEGKMWPKMPLGESRFEVCQRVHQAFGTFQRDADRHDIKNIVVVGHGTTNRAFVQMWCHKRWEWMHKEPNPKNCSIRLIEDGVDKGYIFEGFDNPPGYKHRTNKESEE